MDITTITFSLLMVCGGVRLSEILVYPKLMESRADEATLLVLVNETLALYLEKSHLLAEDFQVTITNDSYSETFVLNGADFEKDLYHNSEQFSSLAVRRLQSGLEMQGILNDEHIIIPVHGAELASDGTVLHKIFKVSERTDEQPMPQSPPITGWSAQTAEEMSTGETVEKTNEPPEMFIVELCFTTTREYREAFKSMQELIVYAATMVNSVKLRYVDMNNPRVRFQFNGIGTINESDYVTHHEGKVDGSQTLTNLANLITGRQYQHCDAVFVLTSLSIKVKEKQGGYSEVHGAAAPGGVCSDKKVGIVTDIPHSYSGARTLAHELGHTLGSAHDGAGPYTSIPDHPGARNCRADRGFLMGSGYLGANKYKLSSCTKQQIRAFVRTLPKSCTNVQAKANYSTTSLPGQGISLKQLCRYLHGNIAGLVPYQDSSAPLVKCLYKCCWPHQNGAHMCAVHNMLDKMACAVGKTCKRGVCDKHKWA